MITTFSVVGFAVLLLLQQESTCFNTGQATPKPLEFSLKLHEKLTTMLTLREIKTKGAKRVVYPTEYGGDPRGEEESSEAFKKALEEAFSTEEGGEGELVRGVKDLGGVVIDLEGGSYKIGKAHFISL